MKIFIAAALLAFSVSGTGLAQESRVQLKDGPGKDKAGACMACHSVDYIQMNSRFLDRAGWTASVTKMINAFGAPIAKEDVPAIVDYLVQNYGAPGAK